MSKMWDIPSPIQIRGAKRVPFFRQLRNLTATLTAYISGIKHEIHNRASALTTTWGLLYCIKTTWTLVHKRLQTGPPFYLPSVNSALCFIARLRRRIPANGTQPNFAKRWAVNCA